VVPASRAHFADADSDGDGIEDRSDLCPETREDVDGFDDHDGCPEEDNDGDSIVDAEDQCPNEVETYNGLDDEDGCPDRSIYYVNPIAIALDVQSAPSTASITANALVELTALAATLKANPGILLLEIQGHADSSESRPRSLARLRAAAVARALPAAAPFGYGYSTVAMHISWAPDGHLAVVGRFTAGISPLGVPLASNGSMDAFVMRVMP